MPSEEKSRIETELEISAYIQDLKYALNNGAHVEFQISRAVDDGRDEKYTNQYTVEKLFPNENPVDALKRELSSLTAEEYIRTLKDLRFPNRSELREFGKVYNGCEDVYIKIRVELLGQYGNTTLFIMLFHFAERAFTPEMFPYRKKKEA